MLDSLYNGYRCAVKNGRWHARARARQKIDQIDAVVRALDELRIEAGLSKAELARRISKNPAVVRRLFSAEVNPELGTIVAIATALNAEVKIVPATPLRSTFRQ